MPAAIRKRIRSPYTAILLLFLLAAGIFSAFLFHHSFSENARFETLTEQIFAEEASASTLTLHYSLADPEKAGISRTASGLGTVSADTSEMADRCRKYEAALKNISYKKLSRENRITLDMLLLYFHTESALEGLALLEEPLGPSLGIQAQLPVLLAEYAFYEDRDIADYLNLLTSIRPYFQSILEFEQQKSQAGLFMSDTTLDRILEQCGAFIKNTDSNYMLEIFQEKLKSCGNLSEHTQKELVSVHKKIFLQEVLPAYQELMAGLEQLRGSGKSSRGLASYENGKQYYLYLLQSQTGCYDSVPEIEKRLLRQFLKDTQEAGDLLSQMPELLSMMSDDSIFVNLSPENTLQVLQKLIGNDFPELSETDYEIRYVHESMEEFLSPAFYLTPPLDKGTPNVIYLNRAGHSSSLEQFTTLAHEGYPGHLYQTVFFGSKKPQNIRNLISCGGYVEGWATYIEEFAYAYAAKLSDSPYAARTSRLLWLNRSISLCIYSLLDLGIHYRGWDQAQAAAFLKAFGITGEQTAAEIYQYIVETPANYLKYYVGYVNFLDLRTQAESLAEEPFSLKEFHRAVLEIGPVPFPVLEKYIFQSTAGKTAAS